MMRRLLVLLSMVALGSCVSGVRSAFDATARAGAQPVGIVDVRQYIDDRDVALATSRRLRSEIRVGPDGRVDIMALSGGGSNGAFTAGIMTGWTEAGTRPDFEIVTGISTGALAAPFVFLGPDWNDDLTQAYIGGGASGLLKARGFAAFFGAGLFQQGPLRKLVESYVDDAMLVQVAAEHARGRRLLVGTTDLDAQRGVVWDMGAIATRGGPDALALFQTVLIASASLPGGFPPVFIQAESGGRQFEEMHIDGGVTMPFLGMPDVLWAEDTGSVVFENSRVHVIINGRRESSFDVTANGSLPVLGRSLDTLLLGLQNVTLAGNRATAAARGLDFEVASIPSTAEAGNGMDFSVPYMTRIYEAGRAAARDGSVWK